MCSGPRRIRPTSGTFFLSRAARLRGSILRDFQNSNSDSGKSSPTTPTIFTGAKKLGAERGVGSGAAEQIGVFFDRSFDGIECDGTNNENGHVGKWESKKAE